MGLISRGSCFALMLLLIAVQKTQQHEDVQQEIRFGASDDDAKIISFTKSALKVMKGEEVLQAITMTNDATHGNLWSMNEKSFTLAVGTTSVDMNLVFSSPNMTHMRISRTNFDRNSQPRDCFELDVESVHWYGGPEARYQYWPLEKKVFANYSYVPKKEDNAGVSERYWLNSKGFFIYVEENTPLFIDQNSNGYENQLCISAHSALPYNTRANRVEFTYHIGFGTDARSTHMYVVKNILGKPTGHPDERMVQHPIWSTWANYKKNINDGVIREFANNILENGFNNSQICIDDEWETCYGSLTFSKEKFPDIKNLTDDLKEKGFRVTLWVHPFINKNCEDIYNKAKSNMYVVLNHNFSTDVDWWNSFCTIGSYLDFTKEEVRSWFTERLKILQQESGIDSFKFDAGETSWAPVDPILQGDLELSPHQLVKDYVRTVSEFGYMIEVRTAQRTQDLPVFIRMIDKDTEWGWNNGLITLIPTLLQMNLNGYPFVLPDMIGGNGYDGPPNKELLIRWLQANVFMPTLQISYAPWNYDDETIDLFKKFTALHSEYTPYIMKRFRLAVETGEPVNLPIWWIAPKDATAHGIYDEYLLGEEILCAPVVRQGSERRDVYLPKGVWKDGNNGNKIIGPIWIMDYWAPLNVLPYFLRESS